MLIVKSMSGRVGCHLSLQEIVAALVCLGYPLCGGGDCSKLREKVLRDLSTPILLYKARAIRSVPWRCSRALVARCRRSMSCMS